MKNRSVFFHCLKNGRKCTFLRRVIVTVFIEIPKVTITEIIRGKQVAEDFSLSQITLFLSNTA